LCRPIFYFGGFAAGGTTFITNAGGVSSPESSRPAGARARAACGDGERFVTDDRFRFLSKRAMAPGMGGFDAESGVNPRPPRRHS
jgi:hypothetical protein